MKIGFLALAASAMIATSAQSAIYTQVFDGAVTGIDTLGYFGTPGATLNTSYKETFLVDTSKGTNDVTSTSDIQYGGSESSTSNPVSGTLTINGISLDVGANGPYGESYVESSPTSGDVYDSTFSKINGMLTLLVGDLSSKDGSSFPSFFG